MPSALKLHPSNVPENTDGRGGPFDVAELTPEQRDKIIDGFAQSVVRRRLEIPAIFFLEMHKPISAIASTAITFSKPTLGVFLGFKRMAEWAALLDERENIERLITRIEQLTSPKSEPRKS